MSYLGQIQNLDWVSPSRIFATTTELFNSQPNYEHEVAIALDTLIKYQGIAPIVGGWGFATGAPGPVPAPVPPPINDAFTKLLVEFDGIEGSTTYPDTNAAGWPRKYKTEGFAGFGSTTNVGEKFPLGALRLDGKTVITAPDEHRFDFTDQNFTIRGQFLADFPTGLVTESIHRKVLVAKTNQRSILTYQFAIERLFNGRMSATVSTREILHHFLLDRFGNQIFDRQGEFIVSRFEPVGEEGFHDLLSVTAYSDTINPGWHEFKLTRVGPTLFWALDNVVEDTATIGLEVVNQVPGPITIGGYGPPINEAHNEEYQGNPWKGGLDRFAVDIGVAR